MSKHSFKKLSAKVIRQHIIAGGRASIEIDKDCWCDIVSASLVFGPAIVFKMAGGNKDEKATLDYEYKVKLY